MFAESWTRRADSAEFVHPSIMEITQYSTSILLIYKSAHTSIKYLHEKIILNDIIPESNKKTGIREIILLAGFKCVPITLRNTSGIAAPVDFACEIEGADARSAS